MAKKKTVEIEGSVMESLPVAAGNALVLGDKLVQVDSRSAGEAGAIVLGLLSTISDGDVKAQFVAKFRPFLGLALEWETKAKSITVVSEDDDEGMAKAREARLFLKSARTALAAAHKESKSDYLTVGRALDAVKNTATIKFEEFEFHLETQEKFREHRVAQRRRELCDRRHEAIMPYSEVLPPFTPAFIDGLADMEDSAFNLMLDGAKSAIKKKIADEKKAERERIAAEKAERVRAEEERARNQALIEENQRLEKRRQEILSSMPAADPVNSGALPRATGPAVQSSAFAPSQPSAITGSTRLTEKQILSIAGYLRLSLSKYVLKSLQNEDGSAMKLVQLLAYGGTKKDGEEELEALVSEITAAARDWKIAI
jgi:hypothetical protein